MTANQRYLFAIITGVLLVTGIQALGKDAEGSEEAFAVELQADTFSDAIQKNNHFVMFFAPWCGHCKRLHPLWEQLAELMNVEEGAKVSIAKVDCTQQHELCSTYDVTGYPTLRFFKLGESESVKFKGTRDLPAITEFINQQLNEVSTDSSSSDDESLDGDAIAAAGKLIELTEANFAKHVSSGNHFVKFFAPWCSHCQRLAPTWEELATSLSGESSVSVAKIDCTQHRPICQDFEVKGYPTLLWIEDGKKIEKYSGSRDHDALKTYVSKMLGTDVKKATADVPATKNEAAERPKVLQLIGDEFAKNVAQGITFVKFYAPWCGHCQKLSPIWDQLADKLNSEKSVIRIAKVDCTTPENKGLCVEQEVEGYPTLFAYKNGDKQAEYDGGRSLAELQHYINKIVGHDEL